MAETSVFSGVPSSFQDLYFQDLYATILFLVSLYIAGDVICKRWLRIVPSLVGQILVGIAFGPQALNVLPDASSTLVLLGNVGLTLLILQAGLEMDVGILRLIGPRGVYIAIVGSILPIGIGIGLTLLLGFDAKTAVATGCCFGPTSAGIAMNVLGQCGVLQKPIGQLIVAAAIVDDMLALIILSQLSALTDDVSISGIIIPITSALLWLVLGGAIALHVMPKVTRTLLNWWKRATTAANGNDDNDKVQKAFVILMVLLLGLLPATFYSEASFLLGAFLAGLAFCRDDALGEFVSVQFKRIITWLMRLFFAATIGFQVPVSLFGNGTVLWKGLVLMVALSGKLAVGPLLTPKLDKQHHWRDCAVVGFSMAGEAEFAFVIAVYGVTNGLLEAELYASVVLAILLSTIASPLLLRTTLAIFPYNDNEDALASTNKDNTGATDIIDFSNCRFWHVQMKSHASWGSLPQLLQSLLDLDLQIVNHHSWHQRHASDDTDVIWMWNDVYAIDYEPSSERDCVSSVDASANVRSTEIKEFIQGRLHDQKVSIPSSIDLNDD